MVVLLWLLLATNWPPIIQALPPKIARVDVLIDGNEGTCSAVVLDATRGYALTAAHCVHRSNTARMSLTVNHRHAEVLRENALLDLAVLHFDPRQEQAMTLAHETPPAGSEIALLGFAFGEKALMVQFGHVALPLDDARALVLDAVAIPGDSGGAAVNDKGELVGLVSASKYIGSASHVALMIPIEAIHDFVKDYLPK